nr:MAG TPA: hypothetical protein [Caudoviricetes sp.]
MRWRESTTNNTPPQIRPKSFSKLSVFIRRKK